MIILMINSHSYTDQPFSSTPLSPSQFAFLHVGRGNTQVLFF